MDTPKMMALVIPAERVFDCLVKKLTVSGIIGNTQGVNSAVNPNKNASINRDHQSTSPTNDSSSYSSFSIRGISSS